MTTINLTEKDISALTEEDIIALVGRLDQDDYNNPFESLKDWHILRTILFQRQDLAEPYLYLLDIEAYDEA
ncbi:protein IsiD [Candidatus Atelocyanobacterium thalassae]|jgi:hypothetical protein|uniref:DUF2555 domain-containing protein n=1 Tax=Atelocyanobacterium thalassa (isolate ALOHA) TaxID=1453429 RepID=D3EQB6_ATETH|nr:DUF2555 domain-containing protein [Candidatus Atelocyanobacterium thalassa]ADB95666.1 Protein of unknown function (DUF2555) [Candidatus Atelocyanobacterium thalassa isolate ALOHA]MCH2543113.1 DUF2555 domain-containing protein [Candidatus Atelocyanobacterium sp. ALOHA_A2.5_9]|tara:strand:+ start:686 stop:898 length:213 start_codon:yes stop_codon:yes gene_type:complete